MINKTERPTKGMFVPCNKDDYVLKEPILFEGGSNPSTKELDFVQDFIEAEERVIFEGFEVAENGDIVNPELGLTAFMKSRNEGSDYYKSIFVEVGTVHYIIERKMRINGFTGVYVPKVIGG